MVWKKKGIIYKASEYKTKWCDHSALTPTPILLNDDIIRVYFGARDREGISRIRFVDLNARNPRDILNVSEIPSLDIGEPGGFDDNGVILGDIIRQKDHYYMFYVGFQNVQKVKFLAFTGLARSDDGGVTFNRVSKTPILDRSDEGCYIRAIHTVIYENNSWKIWYAAGDKWTEINGISYPNYHIKYMESSDLMHLPRMGVSCIQHEGEEYRIGRPRVYKREEDYCLYYTKGGLNGSYLPGFAVSKDGIKWKRQDNLVGITLSENDSWDSKTLCYPSLISAYDKTYMFYNGNSMGKEGFGYAEWDSKN